MRQSEYPSELNELLEWQEREPLDTILSGRDRSSVICRSLLALGSSCPIFSAFDTTMVCLQNMAERYLSGIIILVLSTFPGMAYVGCKSGYCH